MIQGGLDNFKSNFSRASLKSLNGKGLANTALKRTPTTTDQLQKMNSMQIPSKQ